MFVQYSILYPILCALRIIFSQNPYVFPVSLLKIFSTICSPQYCFSHLLPARKNFLSLFHFTVSFFLFFKPELFFPAAFLRLTVLFLSILEQGRHLFLHLSFLNSSAIVFTFLAFILSFSLHSFPPTPPA